LQTIALKQQVTAERKSPCVEPHPTTILKILPKTLTFKLRALIIAMLCGSPMASAA